MKCVSEERSSCCYIHLVHFVDLLLVETHPRFLDTHHVSGDHAHEVVEPTVEPDLQPSVSAPSAPQPANLQTTGAVLVLTSVIIYAAYSTYVSA